MIEWLTGILVVVTAFYAWVTFKILAANEKVVDVMRDQAWSISRPYVVIAPILELDNPIFYLRISNTGKSAAINLRLGIDKSFQMFGEMSEDRNLATLKAFNQPIGSFPPGAEITFSLAQGFVIFAGNEENPGLPHTFSVTAKYQFEGKEITEINNIDLRPYLGSGVPQDAYIRKLKSIDESLQSIAKSANNLA